MDFTPSVARGLVDIWMFIVKDWCSEVWMNVLNTYAEYKKDAMDHKAFDKMLESMAVEDVRSVARKFLKNVKVRDWVIKSEVVNPRLGEIECGCDL